MPVFDIESGMLGKAELICTGRVLALESPGQ